MHFSNTQYAIMNDTSSSPYSINTPISQTTNPPIMDPHPDDLPMLYYPISQSDEPINTPHFKLFNDTELILKKITEGRSLTKQSKEEIISITKNMQAHIKLINSVPNLPPSASNKHQHTNTNSSLDYSNIANIPYILKESIQREVSYLAKSQLQLSPYTTHQTQKTQATSQSKPSLIISPKAPTDNHLGTIQALHRSFSFNDNNFHPYGLRHISHNKIIIELDTSEQRDIITAKLSSHPTSEVNFETPNTLKLMIMLKGILKTTPPDTLAHVIPNQNFTILTNTQHRDDLLL